jgi:hypothetical protein
MVIIRTTSYLMSAWKWDSFAITPFYFEGYHMHSTNAAIHALPRA